jgi:hypothetical protein
MPDTHNESGDFRNVRTTRVCDNFQCQSMSSDLYALVDENEQRQVRLIELGPQNDEILSDGRN